MEAIVVSQFALLVVAFTAGVWLGIRARWPLDWFVPSALVFLGVVTIYAFQKGSRFQPNVIMFMVVFLAGMEVAVAIRERRSAGALARMLAIGTALAVSVLAFATASGYGWWFAPTALAVALVSAYLLHYGDFLIRGPFSQSWAGNSGKVPSTPAGKSRPLAPVPTTGDSTFSLNLSPSASRARSFTRGIRKPPLEPGRVAISRTSSTSRVPAMPPYRSQR